MGKGADDEDVIEAPSAKRGCVQGFVNEMDVRAALESPAGNRQHGRRGIQSDDLTVLADAACEQFRVSSRSAPNVEHALTTRDRQTAPPGLEEWEGLRRGNIAVPPQSQVLEEITGWSTHDEDSPRPANKRTSSGMAIRFRLSPAIPRAAPAREAWKLIPNKSVKPAIAKTRLASIPTRM